MITDIKTVISALLVVLFLTMILVCPNVVDFVYFVILISFILEMKI